LTTTTNIVQIEWKIYEGMWELHIYAKFKDSNIFSFIWALVKTNPYIQWFPQFEIRLYYDNSHSYNKAVFIQEPTRKEDINLVSILTSLATLVRFQILTPFILVVKIYFVQYNCLVIVNKSVLVFWSRLRSPLIKE